MAVAHFEPTLDRDNAGLPQLALEDQGESFDVESVSRISRQSWRQPDRRTIKPERHDGISRDFGIPDLRRRKLAVQAQSGGEARYGFLVFYHSDFCGCGHGDSSGRVRDRIAVIVRANESGGYLYWRFDALGATPTRL